MDYLYRPIIVSCIVLAAAVVVLASTRRLNSVSSSSILNAQDSRPLADSSESSCVVGGPAPLASSESLSSVEEAVSSVSELVSPFPHLLQSYSDPVTFLWHLLSDIAPSSILCLSVGFIS